MLGKVRLSICLRTNEMVMYCKLCETCFPIKSYKIWCRCLNCKAIVSAKILPWLFVSRVNRPINKRLAKKILKTIGLKRFLYLFQNRFGEYDELIKDVCNKKASECLFIC